MMMKGLNIVLMGMGVAILFATPALAETCKVTDPTDTPLNVRKTPNGNIVGKVKNNTVVIASEYRTDNQGRPWALIHDAKNNRYLGWVFREYISCYSNF